MRPANLVVLRLSAAIAVAAVLVVVAGCGAGVNAPAQPSSAALASAPADPALGAFGAPGAVAVCHLAGKSEGYVPISVPAAALAVHLAHGDGLVGHPVPGQPGTKFDPACNPVSLTTQVTITFAGLTGQGSPFGAYLEEGFTVTPVSGAWTVSTGFGHPAPFIQFTRPADAPDTPGEVRITAAGEVFRFAQVDLYSSTTAIPYTFTGLVDGVQVFSVGGTVPLPYGAFTTVPNARSIDVVDAVVVRLVNPHVVCCPNPMGLDNIVLYR